MVEKDIQQGDNMVEHLECVLELFGLKPSFRVKPNNIYTIILTSNDSRYLEYDFGFNDELKLEDVNIFIDQLSNRLLSISYFLKNDIIC